MYRHNQGRIWGEVDVGTSSGARSALYTQLKPLPARSRSLPRCLPLAAKIATCSLF